MQRLILTCACLAGALPSVARAQTAADPGNVTAEDVVTKPLADLNLKRDPIPPILQRAVSAPYWLQSRATCRTIGDEIGRLNLVLGDDIDIVQQESLMQKRENTVGSFARSVVGSLIPFGSLIREISGANENERRWNLAIYAGSARRAYLKGVGQQMRCGFPARPATPKDVADLIRWREAGGSQPMPGTAPAPAPQPAGAQPPDRNPGVRFESHPVIQPTGG
ncbi:MAG: hypothetical protein KGL48_17875 [Sphingomonadales bacterium]|nr:hypothetical protein [Sphingomonadales bacterium]MDE2568637.1 hypothetical protein [Sphingomonadales bacterium]